MAGGAVDEPDLTGATVYEAADKFPWAAVVGTPCPTRPPTFQPVDCTLRPAFVPASTLRDMPA